jgi:hypothetical protein
VDDVDFEIEQGTGRLTRLSGLPSTVSSVADSYEQLALADDDWI